MNFFTFNKVSSKQFGLYISGNGTFNSPERDIEIIDIPGRNGQLIVDNDRFKNTTVNYPSFIISDFKNNATAIRAWLLSVNGYARLEDTYNPQEYRQARFSSSLDFEVKALNLSAETVIAFDCKPQRFLKLGDEKTIISIPTIIYNKTSFNALPLIRVYGNGAGTVTVGNIIIQIKNLLEYLDIDCETQNAYKGIQNCNNNIYAPFFPYLSPGETGISWSGGITKIEIKPRWWTI